MRALIIALLIMMPAWAQAQEKVPIKVVATFSILGDVVKNVGGEKIDLFVLVGPDSDAHTFEPTPQDNVALSKAGIVFENGLHFESWLDKLYEASGSKARRVITTDGVEAYEDDPHVWQDVSNVMIMAEHVRDALMQEDPENSDYYKRRAEKYLYQLGKLNLMIIDTLKDLSDEQRKLITSHDALGYFARRYGFKIIGAAIASASTEAQDPSALSIAKLMEQIKVNQTKVVFTENGRNNKLLQTLAKDAGVIVAPDLYTDALGIPGSEGESYIKMMKYNARILAEYLSK